MFFGDIQILILSAQFSPSLLIFQYFLGAKAPLGPQDVKVKVKVKVKAKKVEK